MVYVCFVELTLAAALKDKDRLMLMHPLLNHDSTRTNWRLYLGVGILSAFAGYLISALPQLIVPIACVSLAVWLIYSGLQGQRDGRMASSPMRLLPWLVYQQNCLRARWLQLCYFTERSLWWQLSLRRPWQSREQRFPRTSL
jgi:hypothetical protein